MAVSYSTVQALVLELKSASAADQEVVVDVVQSVEIVSEEAQRAQRWKAREQREQRSGFRNFYLL